MSDIDPPAPLRPRARAAPFLSKRLRALDTELRAAIPRVAKGGDPEAIHDLRVAIRRMRTMLKLARPIYGRFLADSARRALTEVQRATGELRDEEVLEETLHDLNVLDPGFVAWQERRKARERRLRRAVVDRLRRGELTRARTMLRGLLAFPVKPARDKDLARFARKCVERARSGVEQRRDVEPSDVLGMHDLRIAYKELRYASELLAEALPIDLRVMAEPAAKFQKRLGEVHDVDMAIVTIGRARGLEPHLRTATLELLAKARDKKVARFLAEMSPSPDVSDLSDLSIESPSSGVTPPAKARKPVTRAPARKKKPAARVARADTRRQRSGTKSKSAGTRR